MREHAATINHTTNARAVVPTFRGHIDMRHYVRLGPRKPRIATGSLDAVSSAREVRVRGLR